VTESSRGDEARAHDAPTRREAPRRAAAPAEATAVRVRVAGLPDLDTVVALRIALLREHDDNPVYRRLRPDASLRARPLFAAQLESRQETTFLAERGGEVVGILRCVEAQGSPLLYPSNYAYVSSTYVVPAARRQGVLRSLLGAATVWCGERGLTEIRLHNAPENPLSSGAWEALGFEVVEHLRMRRLP
jgi:ribosomal protein S18 acetylase RimI-like enzyme